MSTPIEAGFIADASALEGLAPEWTALEARDPLHPLCLSHEYFMAWRKAFGDGVRSGVVTLRRGGLLIAVMPVMAVRCWRGPALSVRFDFHPGDTQFIRDKSKWRCLPVNQLSPPLSVESGNLRGGYLADPAEDDAAVWRGLVAGLAQVPDWNFGIFPIPLSQSAARLAPLGNGPLDGFMRKSDRRFYSCTEIRPWDAIVQAMSHNARKSINRATRRAEEAGLRHVLFERPEQLQAGFQHLATIARLSWKSVGRDRSPINVPYTERQQSFYESLGTGAAGRVRPVIFCLFQGEQCQAVALTLRSGSRLTGGITCYAPEIAPMYPGRLMIKAMMNWAAANEIKRFDFNATDTWVEPFSDLIEEYGQLVLFNRRLYGRLLHATARRFADGAASAA
jgi:CelD/BcsL family acetyltransferase involved in cellulose biosynthesis